MILQPIESGDTIDFNAVITKDGAAWDVTGASVTLYLRDPSGAVTSHAASIIDGPTGRVHYQVDASVLSPPGDWVRQWVVSLGSVTLKSRMIEFGVLPSLG